MCQASAARQITGLITSTIASTIINYRQITVILEERNGYGASTEAALTVKIIICICGEHVG
jgi:hypothetical protein